MEQPPKILTREGVLTRTPGMIDKEKREAKIAEAIKKDNTGETGVETQLIKRKKSKAEDAVKVDELKKKLGKAFSEEGLLDRNFGK